MLRYLVPVMFLSTIIYAISEAARFARRRMELDQRPAAPDPMIEQRLERIEQAIDAIAIEMERVSEGQRFTTRLLAERAQPARAPLPGGAPRVDTPH